MKITYHTEGHYLLPDVIPPNDPQIGIWGLRRKNFLLKNRKPIDFTSTEFPPKSEFTTCHVWCIL